MYILLVRLIKFFTLSIIAFIIIVSFLVHHLLKTPYCMHSGCDHKTTILVKKESRPEQISKFLESQDIIFSASIFLYIGKFLRLWKELKIGEYHLSATMTSQEIFNILSSGASVQYVVTVAEGKNIYEIAQMLEANGLGDAKKFTELCFDATFIQNLKAQKIDAVSLEGYLFPNTYHVTKFMSESNIIEAMVRQFTYFWSDQHAERLKALSMTRHQIITLASMIEKETGKASERAIISAVFHNRLKQNIKLQSDPTTIYGIWHRFNKRLRKKDLQEITPYNTYAFYGLPLGPIANPGKDAIEAALWPATSKYLFFVSKNDGSHYFSTTLKEHNQAVQKYQLKKIL